jgi:hypothetical protein
VKPGLAVETFLPSEAGGGIRGMTLFLRAQEVLPARKGERKIYEEG